MTFCRASLDPLEGPCTFHFYTQLSLSTILGFIVQEWAAPTPTLTSSLCHWASRKQPPWKICWNVEKLVGWKLLELAMFMMLVMPFNHLIHLWILSGQFGSSSKCFRQIWLQRGPSVHFISTRNFHWPRFLGLSFESEHRDFHFYLNLIRPTFWWSAWLYSSDKLFFVYPTVFTFSWLHARQVTLKVTWCQRKKLSQSINFCTFGKQDISRNWRGSLTVAYCKTCFFPIWFRPISLNLSYRCDIVLMCLNQS